MALTMSAFRQAREHKFQATSAIVLGYLCAIPLNYFASSAVGKFVGPYTVLGAYFLFLPVAFLSAAFSGWIVSRSHSRAMVLVWATSCIIASAVALAVYAVFVLFVPVDRVPFPMIVVTLAVDFVVGPLGVLAGGLVGARAESHGTSRSI
jgi:hypothetical protein